MTTVLDRNFDVLCRSGTCPSYLIDVLSILVAHANDTELFKTGLRRSNGGVGGTGAMNARDPNNNFFVGLVDPSDWALNEIHEQQTKGEHAKGTHKHVAKPNTLYGLSASHEGIIISAERNLQTYAEDVMHVNDIAMSNFTTQLQGMRRETQKQLETFRDRVCCSVVEKTQEELGVMRSELTASMRADATEVVRELHQLILTTRQQLKDLTSSYTDFMAWAHDALAVAPLAAASDTLKTVEYMKAQLVGMEQAMTTTPDVKVLVERLDDLEHSVGVLVSPAVAPDVATVTTSRFSFLTKDSLPALSSSQRKPVPPNQRYARGSFRLENTTPSSSLARASPSVPASDQPLPGPSASRSCAERFGVTVEAGEDGVVLTCVLPESIASAHRLEVGHIISHVGRTAVATSAAFEEALRVADGQAVKMTAFNPFDGRARVLTVQRV